MCVTFSAFFYFRLRAVQNQNQNAVCYKIVNGRDVSRLGISTRSRDRAGLPNAWPPLYEERRRRSQDADKSNDDKNVPRLVAGVNPEVGEHVRALDSLIKSCVRVPESRCGSQEQ